MAEHHVLRVVANNNRKTRHWTTWVDSERTKSVTSLAEAIERCTQHGYTLYVQPEAFDEMVTAGVAQPDRGRLATEAPT